MRGNDPFENMATWEIEDVFRDDRDKNRFSEEEMLRGYKGFLRKQKGITYLGKEVDMWEIRPPLSL